MAMVAPPQAAQTAFAYSSRPEGVPSKRNARSKYQEDAGGTAVHDEAPWMDENDVSAMSLGAASCFSLVDVVIHFFSSYV